MAENKEGIIVGFGGDIEPLRHSIARATEAVRGFAEAQKESFAEALKPLAALAASVGTIAGIFEGLKGGLDLGAGMQDLASKTALTAGEAYDLTSQFKDAGVAVEALGPALAKMQKNLSESTHGGGQSALLRAMGLDPRTLADESPAKAFREIGGAIEKLPNATERAAAAMQLFGKSGTELLAVFRSPDFRDGGGMTATAKLLEQNAAAFHAAHDALAHVGDKLQGFFVGLASAFVPALMPLLDKFEHMDFSSWGVDLGNIVGNFSTDFSKALQTCLTALLSTLGLVFSPEVLEPFALKLLGIASDFGQKIRHALDGAKQQDSPQDVIDRGGPHAWFEKIYTGGEAFFDTGIQKLLEGIGQTQRGMLDPETGRPVSERQFQASLRDDPIGDFFGISSDFRNYKAASYQQNLADIRGTKISDDAAGGHALASASLSSVTDKLLAQIKAVWTLVITATAATNQANAAGRAWANAKFPKPPDDKFNAADLGVNPARIVSDSLARIGGGGNSVFLSGQEELRRHTSLLQQIAQNTRRRCAKNAHHHAAAAHMEP